MNFSEYYQLFEATSFEDLPESIPYGFWIYPNADFKIVPSGLKHNNVARMIINILKLSKEFYNFKMEHPLSEYIRDEGEQAYVFLMERNFLRVVYVDSALYYRGEKTNNAQLKTLKDLAKYYHVMLVEDE